MNEKMMSKTQLRVIKLISKPHNTRSNPEIDVVLPWLKKKSDVMKGIEDHILKDIVRKCDCLNCEKDEIVIRQGDIGDCFFILLRGSVSVFISENKGGDEALDIATTRLGEYDSREKWQEIAETIVSDLRTNRSRKVVRKEFGKKIVTFGAGKAFGEIALMNEDSVRTASIISDEDCDLMVINRNIYNSTIKAYHEKEFAERREFIDNCILFRDWNTKNKKLLERGLIKECYAMDMPVVKQGQPMRGLIFIRRGNAKVLVEPEQHAKQYPQLHPFQTENDIYELENIKPKKRRTESSSADKAQAWKKSVRDTESSWSAPTRKTDVKIEPIVKHSDNTANEQIRVKRKEGYAAAERRALNKSIILCVVKDGALFGDIELVQDLKTFSHSVVTISYTEIYSLNIKNVERLVHKRNPETLDILEDIVTKKVIKRSSYVQGCHIPLVNHLVFKLTEEKTPIPRPPLNINYSSKSLPDRLTLFKHIVDEYLQNKAQLLESSVPGTVYYKAVMRQRAETRARHRHEKAELRRRQLEQDVRGKMFPRKKRATADSDSDDDEPKVNETKTVSVPPKAVIVHRVRKEPVIIPVVVNLPVNDVDSSAILQSEKPAQNEAFLTEVSEKYSELKATPRTGRSRSRSWIRKQSTSVTLPDDRPDMLRHQSFHTVCMVYDEDEHKSKVIHSGNLKEIAQELDNIEQAVSYDVIPPGTPSDAKMVGAPVHMDSRENSRQSSRRSQRASVVEIVTQKPLSGKIHFPLPPLTENKKTPRDVNQSLPVMQLNHLPNNTNNSPSKPTQPDAISLPHVGNRSYRLRTNSAGDSGDVIREPVHPDTVMQQGAHDQEQVVDVNSKRLRVNEQIGLPKIEKVKKLSKRKKKEPKKNISSSVINL